MLQYISQTANAVPTHENAENAYSKESAERSYIDAMKHYWKSKSWPNRTRAALSWKKAAKQDHLGAQYNLALCYYNGEGVGKDTKAAAYWFKKSAEGGFNKSKEMLKTPMAGIAPALSELALEQNIKLAKSVYRSELKDIKIAAQGGDINCLSKLAAYSFCGNSEQPEQNNIKLAQSIARHIVAQYGKKCMSEGFKAEAKIPDTKAHQLYQAANQAKDILDRSTEMLKAQPEISLG